MKNIEDLLAAKGIKATPNRILVGRCLRDFGRPASMTDVEAKIHSIDKSSVFRVLSLFEERELVHIIDDGSGSMKYELCYGEEGHTMSDMHIHFKCEACGGIFCIESEHVPEVILPEGFTLRGVNYVAKGVCAQCNRKGKV